MCSIINTCICFHVGASDFVKELEELEKDQEEKEDGVELEKTNNDKTFNVRRDGDDHDTTPGYAKPKQMAPLIQSLGGAPESSRGSGVEENKNGNKVSSNMNQIYV